MAFTLFFAFTFLVATELNSSTTSAAEFLIFRRGHAPKKLVDGEKGAQEGGESGDDTVMHPTRSANMDEEQMAKQNEKVKHLARQTDIFSWTDVNYEVPVRKSRLQITPCSY